jgi:hypothetical protein
MSGIDWYGYSKDIIVPVVSPLVAALTVLSALWAERRSRARIRQEELDAAATSLYRDVAYARELYQLLGLAIEMGEAVPPARLTEIQGALDRVYTVLFSQPRVYEHYFGRKESMEKRLLLLLGDLRVRYQSLAPGQSFDQVILFDLYVLLSLYETDAALLEEHERTLDIIEESNPQLYAPFRIRPKRPLARQVR